MRLPRSTRRPPSLPARLWPPQRERRPQMTATSDPNSQIAPDPVSMETFTKVLFDYCEGWVAVREFAEKGNAGQAPRTPFFPADANLARNIVSEAQRAAASGLALYVVPGTVSAQGKAKADDVIAMQTVLV